MHAKSILERTFPDSRPSTLDSPGRRAKDGGEIFELRPNMHPLLYSTLMLLAGAACWWVLSLLLKRNKASNTERVAKTPRFDAVEPGSAPMRDPSATFRDRALRNLDAQYTIIRRTIFLVVAFVWLVIAALPYFGTISTGAVSLLGAGGAVILGIAARPLLENLISGYVVTFSKQFFPGDTVMMDGEYGTIHDITPTHTVIRLWDWRRYVVPNSAMLTKEIISYANPDGLIWACLKFRIAYDADLDEVKAVAIRAARESEHLAGTDDPQLWIMRMDRESIECWLSMWTRGPADAWAIRVATAERLIREFADKGIRSHVYQVARSPDRREGTPP